MTTHPRPKIWLALAATGILAVGVLAVSVEAKPGDGNAGPDDRRAAAQERKDAAMERREAMKERNAERKELRDDIKEACKEAKDNSTLKQRCEHLKDAVKARRVAHALLTAIRVHERELGRVTFRIHELEQKLNGTGLNETAKHAIEVRIGHLEERQERLIEKIADEKAKLQRLHDKWAEVADHLRDRHEKGEDDGGVDDDAETADDSTSTTAAA